MWLILGLYLVAPLLASFVGSNSRRATITATVVMAWTLIALLLPRAITRLGQDRDSYDFTAWTMWTPYVGYFLMGWALRHVRPARRWCIALSVVALACMAETTWQASVAGQFPWLQILAQNYRLGLMNAVAAICIFVVVKTIFDRLQLGRTSAGRLATVSRATFGVYLCHLLVMAVLGQIAPDLARSYSFKVAMVYYLIVMAISFGLSLAAARVPYLRRVF